MNARLLALIVLAAGFAPFLLGMSPAAPTPKAGPDDDAIAAQVAELVTQIEALARQPFEQWDRQEHIRALIALDHPAIVPPVLALLQDEFPRIQERTILWLAGIEGDGLGNPETIAALIEEGLAHDEVLVRQNLGEVLARFHDTSLLLPHVDAFVRAIPRERDVAVKVWLIETLPTLEFEGAEPRPSAVNDLITELAERRGDSTVRAAAIRAYAGLGLLTPDIVEDLVGDRDADLVVAALDAAKAADVGIAEAIDGVAPNQRGYLRQPTPVKIAAVETAIPYHATAAEEAIRLGVWALNDDDDWRTRAAAVEALFLMWDTAAVMPLIDRLEQETGRLRLDIYYALRFYTEQDFGLDAGQWRVWWRANGDRVELGDPPSRGPWGLDLGSAPRLDDNSTTFFELPIVSHNIMFIFDPSGSMRDAARGQDGQSKIEFAIGHCLQTLEGMPEGATFNIMAYRHTSSFPPETGVEQAFPRLVEVSDRSRATARTWAGEFQAAGWGNFYAALQHAMANEDVDTIYFLSDGVPSCGRHVRFTELIRAVQRDNRFRRIVVNTVLIGRNGTHIGFMRDLATAMGGSFSRVDG